MSTDSWHKFMTCYGGYTRGNKLVWKLIDILFINIDIGVWYGLSTHGNKLGWIKEGYLLVI